MDFLLTGEQLADIITAIEQTQEVITDFPVVLMRAIEEGNAASCFSKDDTGILAELVRSDQSGMTHLDNKTLAELHTLLQCYQPGYQERVISPQQHYAILCECTMLRKHRPDFADILIAAIEQGKIYGCCYISLEYPDCGCFYGHLDLLSLVDVMRSDFAKITNEYYTPLEEMALSIVPGQTHENTPELAELRQILLGYVANE